MRERRATRNENQGESLASTATYTIKEASQKLDVKPQSLRRLCNSGLILRIGRSHSGYRVLTQQQIDFAAILLGMKQAGFRSKEIRRYARLYRQGASTEAERTAILTTRKRQLWQEITERQKAIDFIERQEEISQSKPAAV